MVALLIFLQVFAGQGFSSKGLNINAGGIIHNVDIQAAVDCPFFNNQVPGDFSLNVGRRFWFGDFYSATPYIGITTEKKPIYSFEAGRDGQPGKLYLFSKYTTEFYYGIGIKAYIR